jgi:hypothetical protein
VLLLALELLAVTITLVPLLLPHQDGHSTTNYNTLLVVRNICTFQFEYVFVEISHASSDEKMARTLSLTMGRNNSIAAIYVPAPP